MTKPFDPPYEGATLAQLKNENVQQFLYLHGYLRNEMKMLLQLIEGLMDEGGLAGETAELDQGLIQSLIQSGSQYAQHLHAHHHGETALMFPVLARAGLDDEIVQRLNREHDELGALIDTVMAALLQMKTADVARITADLGRLGEALRAHLDYEERHVCPLLGLWNSPAEFYRDLFQR